MKLRKTVAVVLCLALMLPLAFNFSVFAAEMTVLDVSDYVTPGCGRDVSAEIQSLIEGNPNRELYFPDGEYLVSSPVLTPADPRRAVSLRLSDFAAIKATEDFEKGQAVIQLGGEFPYNDTRTNGSNYGLYGGIIDGSGVANGVSINSGRETRIQNTSIKNAVLGLYIMNGANNGSSDADITNVNIIGTNSQESVGVLLEGHDNTLTNMRIGGIFTGVIIASGGNILRNIHPLFYGEYENYSESCGFIIKGGNNWLDYCYSDQFSTGFRISANGAVTMNDCFCYWYSDRGDVRTAIKADKKFNAKVTNFTANLCGTKNDRVLTIGQPGGSGSITNAVISGADSFPLYRAYVYDAGFLSNYIRMFFKIFTLFSALF